MEIMPRVKPMQWTLINQNHKGMPLKPVMEKMWHQLWTHLWAKPKGHITVKSLMPEDT